MKPAAMSLALLVPTWGCAAPDSNSSTATVEESPRVEAVEETGTSATGLAYGVVGEGPWVVLVHGTNLDRRLWDDEVAWLREHARVLRYDLRGQGESAHPEDPFGNHTDLVALLEELDVRDATIVGHSAGAQVALDVALLEPERVARVAFVAPSLAGFVSRDLPPFFTDLGEALRGGDFDAANEVLLASSLMRVPERHQARVRELVTHNDRLWTIPHSFVQYASPPSLHRLGEVLVPALVLVGDSDLAAVREQALHLNRGLPTAKLVVVPGGGHLLNLTSPDTFRAELSAFLGLPVD